MHYDSISILFLELLQLLCNRKEMMAMIWIWPSPHSIVFLDRHWRCEVRCFRLLNHPDERKLDNYLQSRQKVGRVVCVLCPAMFSYQVHNIWMILPVGMYHFVPAAAYHDCTISSAHIVASSAPTFGSAFFPALCNAGSSKKCMSCIAIHHCYRQVVIFLLVNRME